MVGSTMQMTLSEAASGGFLNYTNQKHNWMLWICLQNGTLKDFTILHFFVTNALCKLCILCIYVHLSLWMCIMWWVYSSCSCQLVLTIKFINVWLGALCKWPFLKQLLVASWTIQTRSTTECFGFACKVGHSRISLSYISLHLQPFSR